MPNSISRSAIVLLTCILPVACVAPTDDAQPRGDETSAIADNTTSELATDTPSHGTLYDCTQWIPVPEVVRNGRMAAICSAWVVVPEMR
jgi:hypothetical protein